ncbi:hypothetical protein HGM15179_012375 [Zosterops borbonicus]|uniref:Uncharacterized protein n=1 Tax=Zosterops borbonicus TaxID=364589 RepID=A0A8K1GBF7_9PASS|nr:hypothetical protein HGM15179_012375 [Zosterops borbonicus]
MVDFSLVDTQAKKEFWYAPARARISVSQRIELEGMRGLWMPGSPFTVAELMLIFLHEMSGLDEVHAYIYTISQAATGALKMDILLPLLQQSAHQLVPGGYDNCLNKKHHPNYPTPSGFAHCLIKTV